jgi:hypothetical protein
LRKFEKIVAELTSDVENCGLLQINTNKRKRQRIPLLAMVVRLVRGMSVIPFREFGQSTPFC